MRGRNEHLVILGSMKLRLAVSSLAFVAVGFSAAGCRGSAEVPRAPFSPEGLAIAHDVRPLFATPDAPGAADPHRYEYVFPERQIDVYDIDRGHRLVARWSVAEAHALRGVAVSATTHMLYMSL